MSPPRPRFLARETREWLYAFAAALCLAAAIVLWAPFSGGHP